MNQLMLPSGVDKLSVPQKVVAGGLLAGGLYFALPVLLSLMVNLVMVILIGIPLVFLAYNYQMVWLFFKHISWKSTQFLIGLDVLGYMDRYLDWVDSQAETLTLSKRDLVKELDSVNGELSAREKSYKSNMERAVQAEKLGNTVQLNIATSNAQADRDFIDTLAPIRDEAQQRVEYLSELTDVFATKREQLAYTIKAQKSKFNSLKAMSKGMLAASNVIGQSGHAGKLFEETNNQLINQMNQFTANIKMYDDVIRPAIETNRFDQQLRQEAGMKLLEEFKSTNFQLKGE